MLAPDHDYKVEIEFEGVSDERFYFGIVYDKGYDFGFDFP